MKRTSLYLTGCYLAFFVGQAAAGSLVELYTSQGCYSCPPADQILGELILEHPEHVALEFHVDYWDDLVYGSAGMWKDPFSRPEHSERQREYNRGDLDGQQGVYTPQIVINGQYATVGSSGSKVRRYLESSKTPLDIQITAEDNQLVASITGESAAEGVVWIAEFERVRDTEVVAGENLGKTMRNHHMVRTLKQAQSWDGRTQSVAFDPPSEPERFGCAVIVQSHEQGAVLGAAYCP